MTGATAARRNDYYRRLDPLSMAPLWEVLGDLVTPSPASRCRPACWRYEDVRSLLLESGDLISAREAERRVLVLENPGLRGESRVTTSLYAGLQLILPGEVAPAHRHTQTALRFVVEGEGAYTAVDGEKAVMREGDFIITPSGTWHDHGNESDGPVVWLDGLDIPIVTLLDASFAERHPEEAQAATRPLGAAAARYGCGLLPVEASSGGPASPVFSFPYARTREALDRLRCERGGRRLPRDPDEVRQSPRRRIRAPHHRDIHPASPPGLPECRPSFDRRHGVLRGGRGGVDGGRRRDFHLGAA